MTSLQLVFLAKTLPRDQEAMEKELAQYAETAIRNAQVKLEEDSSTIVSIEDRMTSFDAGAARESIKFMGSALREISDEIRTINPIACGDNLIIEEDSEESDTPSQSTRSTMRRTWVAGQQQLSYHDEEGNDLSIPTETTPLV